MIFYCWNGNKRIEPIECKQRENRLWRCVVRACFAVYGIHMCKINKIKIVFFTILYLTQQKKCDIIIKLSHESESQENKGQRELWNGSGDRQLAVGVVQGKFTWQNAWSVVEWIGWLFWTGCWGKEKENVEWTSVHKMFTWQNRQNVIK